MNLKLPLLQKQVDFLQCQSDVIIYRGAIRSGKTFVGAFKTIIECSKGKTILAIAPTYGMLEDNVVATLKEVGELLGIEVFSVMSKKRVYIGDGEVILRSAEEPDKIRGFKADDMWIDEGSFIKNHDAYLRGFGRLSSNPNRQVWITSSPCGKDWVYKLSINENATLITQSLSDNFFLDQGFFDTLLLEYGGIDSDFAKQELFAEIVTFDNGFFPTNKIVYADNISPTTLTQAFDLAFTDKKNSDYTAYGIGGFDYANNYTVAHVERHKFRAPAVKDLIKKQVIDIDIPTLIETVGTQRGIFDDLVIDPELQGKMLIPVNANINKAVRAMGMANTMNNGKFIMKNAEWNEIFVDEMAQFSINDSHEHDDMIDAHVMIYNHLKYGETTMANLSGLM